MANIDILNDPAFSSRELTDSINRVPIQWGRIGELNVFPDRAIRTTTVELEIRNGILNLLPTRTRGEPGTAGVRGKRDIELFRIHHIPHDTQIKADDVQNVRPFEGGPSELEQVIDRVNEDLIEHRAKHDITREHMRASALRGVIVDADGSTLLDVFARFGVAEKSVDFVLGTATTGVQQKAFEVKRHIQKNLLGDVMTGVRALCSPEFFDKFTSHDAVKRAWDGWNANSNLLGSDPRAGFSFGGITWEEYLGEATDLQEDGTTVTRLFIPAGDCRFYPEGTRTTFATYNAPADFIETVNTPGEPFYAKQAVEPRFQRWVDVHSQQNLLPLPKRPAVLVRGFSSN